MQFKMLSSYEILTLQMNNLGSSNDAGMEASRKQLLQVREELEQRQLQSNDGQPLPIHQEQKNESVNMNGRRTDAIACYISYWSYVICVIYLIVKGNSSQNCR